jgi:hypothetical protein
MLCHISSHTPIVWCNHRCQGATIRLPMVQHHGGPTTPSTKQPPPWKYPQYSCCQWIWIYPCHMSLANSVAHLMMQGGSWTRARNRCTKLVSGGGPLTHPTTQKSTPQNPQTTTSNSHVASHFGQNCTNDCAHMVCHGYRCGGAAILWQWWVNRGCDAPNLTNHLPRQRTKNDHGGGGRAAPMLRVVAGGLYLTMGSNFSAIRPSVAALWALASGRWGGGILLRGLFVTTIFSSSSFIV